MTTMMMSKRQAALAVFASCILLFLVSALQMSGQGKNSSERKDDFALIFVSVFNAQGLSVYGVPVKIRRAEEKKSRWEGYSDHRGEYAQRVPAGKMDYIVWADLKDKAAAKKTEVKISIESDERQDVSLHLNSY